MMRKIFCAAIALVFATNALALNTETKELLAAIAMPLAVDAVSRVTGVPQTELSNLVSTLNQGNVAPTQFVDVMRYTPPALVQDNGQPFVSYVQNQVSQGVTGNALVNAIIQQLQTQYNVTAQPAATTVYVEDNYIPQTVLTRVNLVPSTSTTSTISSDPLAVIALPLAVAAVADIAGVPQDQLASLVATLNNANVPPAQIVEVVRYVPVALIDDGQPFVQYVQQQSQTVTGPALVPVIEQRLRPYYPQQQINVSAPVVPEHLRQRPRIVEVDQNFVPPVVINRVAEVRAHPHGGPPGQIKKQLGIRTGAEVVHAQPPQVQQQPAVVVVKEKEHGRGHERQVVAVPPQQQPIPAVMPPPHPMPVVVETPRGPGRANGNGDGHGNGHGNEGKDHGNGKGKGKGKD